jgi:ethylmalonyl-CoA/methylmalonyl-CoA decarboxylase
MFKFRQTFQSNGRYLSTLYGTHRKFIDSIKHIGTGEVTYSKGPMSEITFNNPKKRNALSGKMIAEFIEIIDDLINNSPNTLTVLLRGNFTNEPAFCSGLDFSLAKSSINTPQKGLEMCELMTSALNLLRNSPITSLALIHGPALGGGAELATACDFRIMTDHLATQIAFVHATIGASPGWGGGARLVSIVGRSHSIRLLGSARRLSPVEASSIGLCDEVAEFRNPSLLPHEWEAMAVEKARSFLRPFGDMPYPSAVRDMKRLVSGLTNPKGDANLEREIFYSKWGSEENKQAINKK